MSDIALYHPHFHFEDEGWLKAAALYWPKIARIVPPHCVPHDSPAVRRMIDELDLVVDMWTHDIDGAVDQASLRFLRFLDTHLEELVPRYGVQALGGQPPVWHGYQDPRYVSDIRDRGLDQISPYKISYALARILAGAGLMWFDHYEWHRDHPDMVYNAHGLRMHPRLMQVYMATLASVVAEQNHMTPVTDLPLAQAVGGWSVEQIAHVLLDEQDDAAEQPAPAAPVEHAEAFAAIALRTVVPRAVEDLPIERIIEARRRLQPQLLAYRQYLDSLAGFFVELAAIPDPQVRQAHLALKVDRELNHRIERLERELRRLRLEPARAVLSLKTLVPPALLAGLTHLASVPTAVTATGMVSGCLLAATGSAARKREDALAGEPAAGYLLALRHELTPNDTLAGLRSAFRRMHAPPRRGPHTAER